MSERGKDIRKQPTKRAEPTRVSSRIQQVGPGAGSIAVRDRE